MSTRLPVRGLTVILLLIFFSTSCTILEDILGGLAELCEIDTYIVTKTEDTNDGVCTADDCSLREAVRQANACPGHQTIRLPAGGYRLTRLGAGEDAAMTGDLDITDDLTIVGEGAPSIHGEDDDRTIEVFSPATVIIDLVILTDGAAPEGSAAYNRGDLTLRNSSVNANNAVVPPGGGTVSGALANEGTLVLVDTQVFDNQGGFGAGVHNLMGGRFDMVGGIISFNTAGGAGGGLWVSEGSSARLENVTVERNSAIGDGGGLASLGNLEVLDSEIHDNDAGQNGGGLWTVFGGTASLLNTPVENNNAGNVGGGIYNSADLVLSEVRVNQNLAGVAGGGLRNDTGGSASLGNTNINENSATSNGGGVSNSARLTFERVTVNRNTTGGQGGGILNMANGTVTARMLEVSGNTADGDGGGIANRSGANLSLHSSGVSGNRSGNQGGAIYNEGDLDFERGSMLENEALIGTAALYNGAPSGRPDASTNLRNITISFNTAPGGQAAILSFGPFSMNHVTLNENAAFGLSGSGFAMANTILENNASGNCGGSTGFASEVGNLDSDGTCSLSGLSSVSAILLPLVSDGLGGVGSVHPLDPASPAIDAASDPECLPQDQRTVTRPQGPACDIGAFELESGEAAAAPDGTPEPLSAPIGTFTSNAFCRQGPSTAFPEARTFQQGQQVELDARNPQNTWSRVLSDQCWVSNSVLDIEGPYEELPVMDVPLPDGTPTTVPTPTPTPTPVPQPPAAPSGLTAVTSTCNGGYEVTVSWADNADNEDGYRVYGGLEGGSLSLIATLGPNATQFIDSPLGSGPYEYYVEAFNGAGAASSNTDADDGCLI